MPKPNYGTMKILTSLSKVKQTMRPTTKAQKEMAPTYDCPFYLSKLVQMDSRIKFVQHFWTFVTSSSWNGVESSNIWINIK